MIGTDPSRAAEILRAGGLVALPTETVYGLAADARQPDAVRRIFTTKGRPADHPLIVHIADAALLHEWARDIPEYARLLAAAYWPGPLTVILHKQPDVLDLVTGGQGTVGIRIPAHTLTLRVLRELGSGVAAPSANKFGKVSPTTAQHVSADLGEAFGAEGGYILDGGPCLVGVESTIIDCTGPLPRLLRAGAVSASMVEETTGLALLNSDGSVRAPGTLPSHYSPNANIHIVSADDLDEYPGAGLIAMHNVHTPHGMTRLLSARDEGEYARGLYSALRKADELGLADACAVLPASDGLGAAIQDRLRRAAY